MSAGAQIADYPILLEPAYKDYVWGGTRIPERYDRDVALERCAESWEISDRPEGMCRIQNGRHAGQSLAELLKACGPALVGRRHDSERFPLLIKLIDARQNLSVQVHPNDATAETTGGEPKTEMWYMLDGAPDARIYAGMRSGTTRERFLQALQDGTLADDILIDVPSVPGQAIFVPGGRVHAIGAGALLLEIQQNSNTTYRVYDWDRMGVDGQPRELHLEQALAVIDWEHSEPDVRSPSPLPPLDGIQHEAIVSCPYFTTERWQITEPTAVTNDGTSFHAIFVSEGVLNIRSGSDETVVPAGTSCLLPAALETYTLVPTQSDVTLIHIRT